MEMQTCANAVTMITDDIRNVLTPMSLVGSNSAVRTLWRRSTIQVNCATSTPISSDRTTDNSLKLRHHCAKLNCSDKISYLEINESPIFQPAVAVFGRKNLLDSDRLSATGVAATLEKMELCANNCDSHEEPQNWKINVKMEEPEQSSSSFQAHEQFKSEINKVNNKKSTTPKYKSLKVYILGSSKKLVSASTASKKLNTPKNEKAKKPSKSPKNKSPKLQRVISSKLVGSIAASGLKKRPSPNKQKLSIATSHKISIKNEGSTCTTSKLSKYAKSPKLLTAARAAQKQYLEAKRKEKEKATEIIRKKEEEEQKRREQEEINKLRQQTIFKAQPIRKYAPLPSIKKRALTIPISSNLSKRRRIDYSSQSNTNSNSNS